MPKPPMPKSAGKVTVRDIAARAEVSAATVSLVLRGKGNLKQETREAVARVIEETGYKPRRPLARRTNGKLFALIVDDITNPYFHELFKGLDKTLGHSGHYTSMLNSRDSVERQSELLNELWNADIGGVILVPATGTSRQDLSVFENRRHPVIMAVRRIGESPFDYVGANPLAGMQLATDHLINLGYRKIGFIGGFKANYAYRERYAGFIASLMGHGLQYNANWLINGGSSREFGLNAVAKLLQRDNLPEALIAYNDLVAFGVMDAIRAKGLTPGREIAVIGYDDIPEAALQPVPLTSIATPAGKLGEIIGQAIISRDMEARHTAPIDITYSPRLVVRLSCGSKRDNKIAEARAAGATT